MADVIIKLKRGTKAKIDAASLLEAEQTFSRDLKQVFINDGSGNVLVGRAEIGLLAARPAAAISGLIYYATDTATAYIDDGSIWRTIGGGSAAFSRAVDFYEGSTPPYIADVDAYSFQDAAGFPVGEDRDVILKIEEMTGLYTGFDIYLVYVMSTADAGNDIRLTLDYLVHQTTETYGAGTAYGQTQDITISTGLDILGVIQPFTIPNGHVTGSTVEVELRLTREGAHINDTHSGDFGLKHLIIVPA